MCPPGYHRSGLMVTCALWHTIAVSHLHIVFMKSLLSLLSCLCEICVCVCVCVCVCIYLYLSIYLSIYLYMYIYTHTHICNGFLAAHAVGHMMYSYILLVLTLHFKQLGSHYTQSCFGGCGESVHWYLQFCTWYEVEIYTKHTF